MAAVGTYTCVQVNDYFARETGRINIDIHDRRIARVNLWGTDLVKRAPFPQGMGTNITEETIARILTSSDESDWTNVGTSGGNNASAGCLPPANALTFGNNLISWNLQTKYYQTPCICLDDLKTSFQIKSQIAKTVTSLTTATDWIDSNRLRYEFMRITPKVSMTGNDPTFVAQTAVAIDGNTPPPTSQMAELFLEDDYLNLARIGAWSGDMGMLVCDPEVTRQLLRNNPELRKDTRFGNPSALMNVLKPQELGQWRHVHDLFMPRFNYNAALPNPWVRVMPFLQTAVTEGSDWFLNPAYTNAQYGTCFAYDPEVMEQMIQQTGPDIPDAPFTDYPYYYNGQAFWLNIISDNNPFGKIGRWALVFQSGTRPIHPEYGRTYVYLRCSDVEAVGCTYPYHS